MSCITMLRSGGLCFRCAPGRFRQSSPKWTSPRVAFAKVARNGPRPGSLSPKLPEMDLAPGRFRQSCPKWTSPRITFAKAARNGPRPGSLSPKLPEMDLAPGRFRQSCPKWTSPRVTFAKVARNGPRPGSLSPKLPEMGLRPRSGGESRKIRERGRVSPPTFSLAVRRRRRVRRGISR